MKTEGAKGGGNRATTGGAGGMGRVEVERGKIKVRSYARLLPQR